MPLYKFQCQDCGHTWERLSFNILEDDPKCSKCGCIATKVISAPTLQFKGPGWTPKSGGGRTE